MQTALILMTILGCDDSATQCHYLEMLDERWTTIQACNAVSEDRLSAYSNVNYPVVVAVCQTPEDSGLNEVAGDVAADPGIAATVDGEVPGDGGDIAVEETARDEADFLTPPADIPMPVAGFAPEDTEAEDEEAGIARRILARIGSKLPEAASLKTLVGKPVHVVTDSYSWVARRFED
ncbi:hypothetical protein [uncultured Hoeflea sp.]|uniref:hypothetical protein n=1 Tax=uncultured Hoeflea sp. TaxID=538666 RepID=UPI002632E07B|nr:hypothetical protein [uncultured Hoeflea sp.]